MTTPQSASLVDASARHAVAPWFDGVDTLIARSHRRSLDLYRLDPAGGSPRVVPAAALRERREPLEPLLAVARSGMESLFLQIRDLGYVVLLTDPDGVAVEFIHNPAIAREARRAGLGPGGCWTEKHEGTCAVGMALVDRLSITVHHGEHFQAHNARLTCSASPILAADGRLLAVLDATALHSPDDRRSQHLALKLVHATARMIENADFLRCFERHLVLRTSTRREFLEVATEGLVALDAGGHVVAANQCFVQDMGLDTATLRGRPVEEVFGVSYAALLALAGKASSEPVKLRLQHSGSQCFALARSARRPMAALRQRAVGAQAPSHGGHSALLALAGLDPAMQANVARAHRLIDKGIAVLLQGESGTGKEAFAKAMHAASSRAAAPFVALNCAAIPETLIESELFGHREGAFTGARTRGARGKIEQAHGGTLFLDEIGDMPPELQTRLLRVLAEREVTPLGAEHAVAVDLQVICATHRDLGSMVQAGAFRLDLFYRLNGFALTLPPLRERADLPTLIDAVLADEAASIGGAPPRLSPQARTLLLRHRWPGNIRELKNCLRAALALCDGDCIEVEHLGVLPSVTTQQVMPPRRLSSTGWDVAAEDFVPADRSSAAHMLRKILHDHGWNITDTARSLGVSRSTVYRRMSRLRIVEPNRTS